MNIQRHAPLVIHGDPLPAVLKTMGALTARIPALSGFSVDTELVPNETPNDFIRIDRIGETPIGNAGFTDVELRIQIWADGAQLRSSLTHQIAAHLRAELRTQLVSGPVDMPDPVDETRQLTQFTMSIITKGQIK